MPPPKPISSGYGERQRLSRAVAQLRALVYESVTPTATTTREQWLVWVEDRCAAACDGEPGRFGRSTRGGGRWSAGSWRTAARRRLPAAISTRIRPRSRCFAQLTASAFRSCLSIPASPARAAAVVLDALAALLAARFASEPA
jgi:hypothetical protein